VFLAAAGSATASPASAAMRAIVANASIAISPCCLVGIRVMCINAPRATPC
jgi:hypothetical protein